MNNASIHHDEIYLKSKFVIKLVNYFKMIRVMIEDKDCKLKYFSLYSPDFNSIKYTFSVIKNVLKGLYQFNKNENFDEMAEKLKNVIKIRIISQIIINEFHAYRIPI